MGGTFDLFDGHCDGQNGLHTHCARQRNVCDGDAWCEQAFTVDMLDLLVTFHSELPKFICYFIV